VNEITPFFLPISAAKEEEKNPCCTTTRKYRLDHCCSAPDSLSIFSMFAFFVSSSFIAERIGRGELFTDPDAPKWKGPISVSLLVSFPFVYSAPFLGGAG
jgi:hypothetical protein